MEKKDTDLIVESFGKDHPEFYPEIGKPQNKKGVFGVGWGSNSADTAPGIMVYSTKKIENLLDCYKGHPVNLVVSKPPSID